MLRRTAVKRVISILLLAACGAWCQEENHSAGLPQGAVRFDGSNVPEAQHEKLRAPGSLPDAPAVQAPTRAEKLQGFAEKAHSPLNFGAVAVNASVITDKETNLAARRQPSPTAFYGAPMLRSQSSTFLDTYLHRSLLKPDPRYHPWISNSIVSRASYALSCDLITGNNSGKSTLNTSYLLGVLISAAVATADRPYWARSTSTTFNKFGSTIGSDAGKNFFHEFQPGIRQMLNSHSPKFVKRLKEIVTNDPTL
jgi:hypothetical protein